MKTMFFKFKKRLYVSKSKQVLINNCGSMASWLFTQQLRDLKLVPDVSLFLVHQVIFNLQNGRVVTTDDRDSMKFLDESPATLLKIELQKTLLFVFLCYLRKACYKSNTRVCLAHQLRNPLVFLMSIKTR